MMCYNMFHYKKKIPLDIEIESVHPFNGLIATLVFPYLDSKDLLSASMVNKLWHEISMDKKLWKNIKLKNVKVKNWDKLVDTINQNNSVSLDTKNMFIPKIKNKYNIFWKNFNRAIVKAEKLKQIYVYKCPPYIVETLIETLQQLDVLQVLSIKNPFIRNDQNCVMLRNIYKLVNLTELRIKSLNKILFLQQPSFERLINLKTLVLTSITSQYDTVWHILSTVSIDLVHLEIGDCISIDVDFAVSLKRFVNLTFLRLEKYNYTMDYVTEEVFKSIISLRNLTSLQLVNIDFNTTVRSGLEKCDNIKKLLILPNYNSLEVHPIFTNHCIICGLKKLSNTLKHFVWAVPKKFRSLTIISLTMELLNKELSSREYLNHLRNGFVEIKLLVPILEALLNKKIPNIHTNIIRIPLSDVTNFYLE